MTGNRDAQHLALDAPVEALHHPVRAGRIGPRLAMDRPERLARPLEAISREAGATVGQHMGDLEGEGPDGLVQEGHRRGGRLVVLDREMDEARGTIDRHMEVALAGDAISVAQLGQVLHVQVHEARS